LLHKMMNYRELEFTFAYSTDNILSEAMSRLDSFMALGKLRAKHEPSPRALDTDL
jgi:hypothetical protein